MPILVTGGAGYIGSHTCLELLQADYDLIVVDNLSNSKAISLDCVKKLTGKDFKTYQVDLLNKNELEIIFRENQIEAVIHFANLKVANESVVSPLRYYQNNITGTLHLLEVMQQYKVMNLVFSSSAAVYGIPDSVPVSEEAPLKPVNPYGRTKRMIEEILQDLHYSNNDWHISVLRYFNPMGSHESGLLGEDSKGIPNNIMPYITQVAIGNLKELSIFGNDYDTVDGTGIRDYIHVVDLANGHLRALEKIVETKGIHVYNLGTGHGYSVLQILSAFELASSLKIPYKIACPRQGDVAICIADSSKALKELGWEAKKDVHQMCVDAWRWQKGNPFGYNEESSK